MIAPTVGRIVHWQPDRSLRQQPIACADKEPLAALVLYVDDDSVATIRVFWSQGTFDVYGAPQAAEPTPGHWNWPPRA